MAHHPRSDRRQTRRRTRRTGHRTWRQSEEDPDLEADEEWIAVQEF